ncbi:sensor histidine kinase [Amycolatopsis pigmentata]|uniref:histidine kinase n=1 Tax=Amycolatopsis pigmentata TaxID=450801 RepID=A0ABW5FP67_9PSEU
MAPPELAALLLAKVTIAAERDVRLVVSPESHLDVPSLETRSLLTVLGNLIDNAVDAVAGGPDPRRVDVHVSDAGGEVSIVVTDTGPGVAPGALERIFTDGYSTKPAREGMRRGLGLALVRRLVHRAGGSVDVTPGPGARFAVRLPHAPVRARLERVP